MSATISPGYSLKVGDPYDPILLMAVLNDQTISGVTGSEISSSTISTSNLQNAVITSDKIAADAVTATKIIADAIDSTHIASNTISADNIQSDTLTTTLFTSGSITTDKIAAGAVTTAKLDAEAVSTPKIAADSINASKISSNAIETDGLAADAVTAVKIAADAVTSTKIYADAVTSAKINVDDLSAISANLGTITSGTVTAATLQTSSNPAVSRVRMTGDGLTGYDSSLGQTFKLPTDGSSPVFASGQINSATIVDTTIISNDFKTADSLPWLELTASGLAYRENTGGSVYGTAVYGTGTYGSGVFGYVANSSKPFVSIEKERTLSDIHLFNRSSNSSGASTIGDLEVVSGELYLCTTEGTPGTFTKLLQTGEGGASQLTDLSDVNTAGVTNRNVLVADGTDFESRALVEADISDLSHYTSSDFDTDFAGKDTGDLSEGTNLYFTTGRVDSHLSGGTAITYSSGTIAFNGSISDLSDSGDVVTPSSTDTLTNKTFNANGTGNSLSNVETADIASGSKSGSDSSLITGTAGSEDDLGLWDTNGDMVSITPSDINTNNLLLNGAFKYWYSGTSSAPSGGYSSTSVSIDQEASIVKIGDYSMKVTAGSIASRAEYTNIHTEKGLDYWKGKTITLACWVYSSSANSARLRLADGDSLSISSQHTGGGSWELLTVTHTISSSATTLEIWFRPDMDDGNDVAYFDGAMLVEGSIPFAYTEHKEDIKYNSDLHRWDSGIIDTPNQSGCSVYQNTAQDIPDTDQIKIEFDTINYDIQNEFDNSTNYRFTATKAGKYSVFALITLNNLNAGDKILTRIYVNESEVALSRGMASATGQVISSLGGKILELNANDYVEVYAYHNEGTTQTTLAQNKYTYLTISKIQ